MQNNELALTYSSIDALIPHPRNARTHSTNQIEKIAKAINQFGFLNPVLIDGKGQIIAGHGRVAAAKLLGIQKVPVLRIEHLSEDQLRAHMIADNRIAEKAGWDRSILAIEFQHLVKVDDVFEATITGFEIPEIDKIIFDAGQTDQEEPAEIIESLPAVSAPGDLWLMGPHRLLCGNALDQDSYAALMQDKQAHLIFTDPPYNVPIDGHVSGKGKIKHREFAMASGEMSPTGFTAFLTQNFRLLALHSHPGSIHFVCMDWRHLHELLSAGEQIYGQLKNLCVWAKDNGGMGSLYRSRHELIFVFKNGDAPHKNNVQLGRYGRNRTNVWSYPSAGTLTRQGKENLLALHPTVKPVEMIADAILDCSARSGIVLDPFLGSGTTLLAAEKTGRLCFGMELDPLYVDTAIQRWQRKTGNDAIHALTGKSFNESNSKESVYE